MNLLGQIDLNSLLIFQTVVETGGFTAAADRLGMAKAKVSIQINRLETRLGTVLFTRTTRCVSLTEAGRALHDKCKPLLHELQFALEQTGSAHAELAGTLRLSTTVDHAMQSLGPAVAHFAALHPGLQIDLRAGDTVTDLVAEGIDLAIRFGWLPDSSLRAVKLGEFEQHVLASPDYLGRAGVPRHPEDLAQHEWLALSLLPAPLTWKFTSSTGETKKVQVKSRIKVNSPGVLRTMLSHGAGISVMDPYSTRADVDAGKLMRVLPDWALPRGGVYAVYPAAHQAPPRVRAFIDFYRNYLKPF